MKDLNMQKNIRDDIEHANSLDYNGMKTPLFADADSGYPAAVISENGNPGIEKGKIENISSDLAEKFWQATTEEDIFFIETRSYIITSV